MKGFYIFIAVASLISILVTFCLGRFFKNITFVKYIPAIVSALAAVGFYLKSRFFSMGTGFEDLGYIVLMLIAAIVFFISLVTALIMEVINRNSRRNF